MKTLQKKLLLFLLILPIGMFAQNTLKGVVLDGKTQQPMPSVSVVIEGTNTMTATDFDGNFTLSNLIKGQKIKFSFIGFTSQTLVYENSTRIIPIQKVKRILLKYQNSKKRRKELKKPPNKFSIYFSNIQKTNAPKKMNL